MKYGLCEWLLPVPGPISIELAGRLGFDGVQVLDYGGRENNYPLNLPWVQDAFKQSLDKAGVVIQTLQLQSLVRSGGVKCDPSTHEGKRSLEDIEKGALVCKALGIENLQLENFFDSSITCKEDIINTANLLKEASKITACHGVQLVYESWFDYEGTMKLFDMADESFKLCYDTLNPLRYDFGDPLKELTQYDPGMFAFVHVKDAPSGYAGSVCLGEGAGLFNEACSILKERGYDGWVVSENYYCLDPMGAIDPAVNAAKDLNIMRSIFE